LDLVLSRPLESAVIAAIRSALDQAAVLLFRGQELDPERQIALSRQFGPLQEVAQKQYQLEGWPLVYVIGNVTEGGRAIGDPSVGRLWHSDQSFIQAPAFGSMLYGVTCPPEGADTVFANMYLAYEALPDDVRQRIRSLHGIHSFSEYYEELRHRDPTQPPLTDSRRAQFPDVTHPLVRRNPRTGREALYVNPGYAIGIAELPGEEGARLLQFLCEHACRDDFVYAHKWEAGDLLFWDNLATNHKGTAFDTTRYVRRMHRTTLASSADAYRATLLD
jgi:taurine dioxygenase